MEHFEDGPIAALAEARRVIAPDGWLLCSVPDVSPLRKHILYRAATETRGIENGDLFVRRASQMAKDRGDEASAGDPTFFQYVFEEREFREHLKATGFEVVETFGESMLWGLLEVVPIRHLCEGATLAWRTVRPRRTDEHGGASTAAASNGNGRGGLRSSLRAMPRRLLLNEDRTIPILGPMLSVAVELTANLRMYVARPS